MTRLDIQFCPFCGSENDKLSYEQARIRCHRCGRLFSVKELKLLRRAPTDSQYRELGDYLQKSP